MKKMLALFVLLQLISCDSKTNGNDESFKTKEECLENFSKKFTLKEINEDSLISIKAKKIKKGTAVEIKYRENKLFISGGKTMPEIVEMVLPIIRDVFFGVTMKCDNDIIDINFIIYSRIKNKDFPAITIKINKNSAEKIDYDYLSKIERKDYFQFLKKYAKADIIFTNN